MSKSRQQLSLTGFEELSEAPSKTPPPPPGDLAGKTVFVVDSHSLIFQVFHALGEMTSPRGEPVSAIYGFTRDLFFLLREKKPDFLICAFDMPSPTFRHDMFPAYKADRGEMPDDLAAQFPLIRKVLDAMGIPVLGLPGFEADDIIATLARICTEVGTSCMMVTGDKDCRQLINDRVKIYNMRKDEIYDSAALAADWGIRPDQVVDFQSLVGDSVDNVPGVPLIGPKFARQLLEQYDTLDQILDHAGEVAGTKRRQNLIEGRDQALLSRELVRLVADVPVTVDWSAARAGQIDREAVLALFSEFGFRSLGDQLNELLGVVEPEEPWDADYRCVTDQSQLDTLIGQLRQQSRISFDIETTSRWPRWAEPVGYSVSFSAGEAYYIPVRAPAGEPQLNPTETLEALRPILEDASIEKVGQNLKYDMIVLRGLGVQIEGLGFDTMVASYLLEAGQRNHSLDELSKRYLNHETTTISTLIGSGKQQKRMDEVPVAAVTDYACEDADVPLRLLPILQKQLDELALSDLFRELELPLIDVLVEMEFNGIKVDVDRLGELSDEYLLRLETLKAEIYELAGHPFNISSPKQLAEVLFKEQGLPIVKKTRTGASTDADVLEQLADKHPLPAKIIEYRQFAKLKNTYVDALPAMVHSQTGRVHASFHQVVAATGRLSSSDPNLQNIPIRTDAGREIRSAFLPGQDGWQLLAADYSQIELRVLAHCSGDEALLAAFENDEDIHAAVASQVYGVPQSEVTPAMRRSAKAVNFGIIYGQSPFGLAKSLDIEHDEAGEFIDAYFAQYPQVDRFLRDVLERCHVDGFVSTLFGRRRAIRGVRQNTPGYSRNLPERTAVNTVIQGTAADLIKRAMISVHRRLKDEKFSARLLLQIHDELVFEFPDDEQNRVTDLVRKEMSGAAELTVPLKVDIKIGANWSQV
ncbi:MAG: DNA polymerase I [Pirellulales bacterium]